jgi:hypothetical protein
MTFCRYLKEEGRKSYFPESANAEVRKCIVCSTNLKETNTIGVR